jgi:hypothetical protein
MPLVSRSGLRGEVAALMCVLCEPRPPVLSGPRPATRYSATAATRALPNAPLRLLSWPCLLSCVAVDTSPTAVAGCCRRSGQQEPQQSHRRGAMRGAGKKNH